MNANDLFVVRGREVEKVPETERERERIEKMLGWQEEGHFKKSNINNSNNSNL